MEFRKSRARSRRVIPFGQHVLSGRQTGGPASVVSTLCAGFATYRIDLGLTAYLRVPGTASRGLSLAIPIAAICETDRRARTRRRADRAASAQTTRAASQPTEERRLNWLVTYPHNWEYSFGASGELYFGIDRVLRVRAGNPWQSCFGCFSDILRLNANRMHSHQGLLKSM